MSWTRFGQLSAETQSLADVAGLGGAGYTVSNTQAYTGARSYRTSGTNAPLGFAGAFGVAARAGMYFRHNGTSLDSIAPLIGFQVDGCTLLFRYDASNNDVTLIAGYNYNTFNVRTAATVNVPALASMNTWMHIGMTAYMAASDGFASLYVDGVRVANWTGDTRLYRTSQTQPRTNITGIYAAGSGWTGGGNGSWTSAVYIDDFYADTWTGESAPTDAPVPSRRFYPMMVTSNGAEVGWAPNTGANYECVDEGPPDDDTTYVLANTAGLLDRFVLSDVTLDPDYAVRALIALGYAKKTDAGIASTMQINAYDGASSTVLEGTPQTLSTSYGYVYERWETDFDGNPWDLTDANNVQFGYLSTGDFS